MRQSVDELLVNDWSGDDDPVPAVNLRDRRSEDRNRAGAIAQMQAGRFEVVPVKDDSTGERTAWAFMWPHQGVARYAVFEEPHEAIDFLAGFWRGTPSDSRERVNLAEGDAR